MQTPMPPVSQCSTAITATAFQVKKNGAAINPRCATAIQMTTGQSSPFAQGSFCASSQVCSL